MIVGGWRIVAARHAATAFSGEGARRYGGGWNSPGVSMVYLSEHQSLAALEILIHFRPVAPTAKYVAIRAEWDEKLMERLSAQKLPANWRDSPPGPATMSIGDAWVKAQRSAVLAVPSVIVPNETNFLLNPAHVDFRRVRIHKAAPFAFDPRLVR